MRLDLANGDNPCRAIEDAGAAGRLWRRGGVAGVGRRLRHQSPQLCSRLTKNPTARGQNQTALAARLPRSGRAKGPMAQGSKRETGGRRQQRQPPPAPGQVPPQRCLAWARRSPNLDATDRRTTPTVALASGPSPTGSAGQRSQSAAAASRTPAAGPCHRCRSPCSEPSSDPGWPRNGTARQIQPASPPPTGSR